MASLLLASCSTPSTVPPRVYPIDVESPVTSIERERLTSAASCDEHRREIHGGAALPAQQQTMRRELLAYQALVEEALSMRAKAIQLLAELQEKTDRGASLSGRDLLRLNQGASALLEQRAALFRMSLAHECWLNDPVPTDRQAARLQATGIAISLSAALVLYDNYLSAISLYRSDSDLRQHLNRSDSGFAIRDSELNRIAASFASPENRARVRRGIAWFETHGQTDRADPLETDDGYRYLVQLIEQSPSRQLVRHIRLLEFAGNMLGLFSTLSLDSFQGLRSEGVHVSSLIFGNAVGLIESRRGKLDGRADVMARLAETARAGDILLEKTPFRLTDAFIPGHWGHVAIWVGTEAELRALGIWDHPAVLPHQAAIRAGRGVVEALRSGVVMNSQRHFINIDDLAVLRHEDLPPAQRIEVILQALRQVGKAYDFNFDVRTTDRIVCSELIYHSYVHLDWPTDRYLGRVTISPDNVAVRATGIGPLRVVLLYHDGVEIAAGRQEAMERFIKAQELHLAHRQI